MFTLKKWYFDFLTPDRTYVFVYFAYVNVLGHTKGSLTIHCARPGKGSPLTRSFSVNPQLEGRDEDSKQSIQLPGGELVFAEDRCMMSFVRDDCSLSLRFDSRGDSRVDPLVINTGGKSNILWKPIGLRYHVSGRITLGEETIPAEGSNGYVDFLHSSYLPLVVPVSILYWGRLHHADIDAVYVHAADFHNERSWSKLYTRYGGIIAESNQVSILDVGNAAHERSSRTCPEVYEVVGSSNSARVRLRVRHVRPVQEMGFIDQQEINSPVVRSLVKLLTRNPRSTKFLSHADIALETKHTHRIESQIPMIDEFALL